MYRITEKIPTLSRQQASNIIIQLRSTPIIFRNSQRNYDTGIPSKKRGGIGKPLFYTIATATAISVGAIAYAKYDNKFRKQLISNVPGSAVVMKFIFADEKHLNASTKSSASSSSEGMMNSIYKMVGKEEKPENVAVPPSLLKKTKASSESVPAKKETSTFTTAKSKKDETRVPENTSSNKGEPKSSSSGETQDLKKYNMVELEKEITEIVLIACSAFSVALKNLKEYREEVADLIEKSVQNEENNIWFRIKEKTEQKDQLLQFVEDQGNKAMQKLEHFKLLISDPKTNLEPEAKAEIENKIKNLLDNYVLTKALFNQEKIYSSVTDKFSKKVEESRQTLSKELGVLFPSVFVDSESVASDEDLELFVLYACQLVNFYQKELQKLETIGKAKVDKCIELAKAGNPEVVKEAVSLETEKLRREFAQEIMKKELSLKSEYEKQLKSQMRREAEVHVDHLEEIIEMKNKEMERKMNQNVTEKVEDMRINYNRQLARIIGRMKGLDDALKEKAISEKQAKHSQLLWNACQSLILSLKSGTNTKLWNEQLKPLENEVNAIFKAAAQEDTFVCAIINAIPEEAKKRGVFSELALRDRFLNVEKIAHRVANIPEGFVSLPKIFLSYLQSFLLVRAAKPIPTEELLNEPFDVSSLNNYDVLSRARYWLDRGDFEQCLKYMNLLKGAARAIANEWMDETRIFLETQQAANLLLSHAVYSSLVYLQNSS